MNQYRPSVPHPNCKCCKMEQLTYTFIIDHILENDFFFLIYNAKTAKNCQALMAK